MGHSSRQNIDKGRTASNLNERSKLRVEHVNIYSSSVGEFGYSNNQPQVLRGARILFLIGTKTITTTSTSVYTFRLSAICSSTGGFAKCPSV